MAVVLAVRLLLRFPNGPTRAVAWASGPGVGSAAVIHEKLMQRLGDPGESDSALSDAVSATVGTMAAVTTYADPFELRKLQVLLGRASGDAAGEDDAVMTFHFLKLVGGAPNAEWVAGDFTAIETAFDTVWATYKTYLRADIRLKEFRWYRTGPQRDEELGGPGRTGPPVRVVTRNVVGTNAGTAVPPQVAVSVTEQTSSRKTWGRFYLPGPVGSTTFWVAASGRLDPTWQSTLGNLLDAFYEAALANGTPVVVYSAAKPERPQASGPNLPAIGARALTVDQLQIDDVPDVIRSRRWNRPLLKLQRAVG